MTVIHINENEKKIILNGHADDSRVCAGISALVYAFKGYLDNFAVECDYRIESGEVFCHIKDEKGTEVFNLLTIGLMQIEKAHPENVKIFKLWGE